MNSKPADDGPAVPLDLSDDLTLTWKGKAPAEPLTLPQLDRLFRTFGQARLAHQPQANRPPEPYVAATGWQWYVEPDALGDWILIHWNHPFSGWLTFRMSKEQALALADETTRQAQRSGPPLARA